MTQRAGLGPLPISDPRHQAWLDEVRLARRLPALERARVTRELDRLGGMLADLARDTSPFEGRQPPRETNFVEPVLVASVGYGEWTQAGTLRHPRYLGLRDDVAPEDVVLEESS